jgi:hypothetical protein
MKFPDNIESHLRSLQAEDKTARAIANEQDKCARAYREGLERERIKRRRELPELLAVATSIGERLPALGAKPTLTVCKHESHFVLFRGRVYSERFIVSGWAVLRTIGSTSFSGPEGNYSGQHVRDVVVTHPDGRLFLIQHNAGSGGPFIDGFPSNKEPFTFGGSEGLGKDRVGYLTDISDNLVSVTESCSDSLIDMIPTEAFAKGLAELAHIYKLDS